MLARPTIFWKKWVHVRLLCVLCFVLLIPVPSLAAGSRFDSFFCTYVPAIAAWFGGCGSSEVSSAVVVPERREPLVSSSREVNRSGGPASSSVSVAEKSVTHVYKTYVTHNYFSTSTNDNRQTLTRIGDQFEPGVSRVLFTRQVNRIFDSIGTHARDINADMRDQFSAIENSFATHALTVQGNTTMSGTLTVSGQGTFGNGITLSGTSSNLTLGANYLSGDGDDEGVYIDAYGKVGLGTTTPSELLSLDDGALYLGNYLPSVTTNRLYAQSNSLYWGSMLLAGASVGNWTGNGADVYRLTGNVGIGTSTSSYKLSVSGDSLFSGSLTAATSTFAGQMTIGEASSLHAVGASLRLGSSNSGTEVSLQTSNVFFRSGITLLRTRGTVDNPTAVALEDKIGFFGFKSYDGNATQLSALVEAYVDGAVSSGSVPARLSFVTGSSAADRQERLVIKNNGYVGIGTSSPLAPLHVVGIGDGRDYLDVYGNGAAPLAGFITRIARGTSASPTAIQAGDTLATLSARGYGATGFSSGSRAVMSMFSAETWTDTAQGTFITFATTPLGSSTVTERLRIDPSGKIGIGTNSPSAKFDLFGIAGSSDVFAISSSSGARQFSVTASGNVGIATSTPTNLLTIGNVDATTLSSLTYQQRINGSSGRSLTFGVSNVAAEIQSAGSIPLYLNPTGSNNVILAMSGGLVGIGTSSPESLLDVDGVGTFGVESATTAQLVVKGGSSGAPMLSLKRSSGSVSQFSFLLAGGGLTFSDDTNGFNVTNIYGDTLKNQLYIGQRDKVSSDTRISLLGGTTFNSVAGNNVPGNELRIQGGLGTGAGLPGDLTFYTGTVLASGSSTQSGSSRLVIKGDTGNVGIGTSTPTQLLSLVSSAPVMSFYATNNSSGARFQSIQGSTPSSNNAFRFQTDAGTDLMSMTYAGNVGIGTASPLTKLEVKGNILINNGGGISISNRLNSTNYGYNTLVLGSAATTSLYNGIALAGYRFSTATPLGRFTFNSWDTDDILQNTRSAEISSYPDSATTTDFGADLRFYTRSGTSALAEAVRIGATGNVGIGTTTASSKLTVAGTLGVTSAATFSAAMTVAGSATFNGVATVVGTSTLATTTATSLGVGITPTAAKFQVAGGNVMVGGFGSGTDYGILFTAKDAGSYTWASQVGGVGFQLGSGSVIGTTPQFTLTNGGNVGIGTTTPSLTLDVNGSVAFGQNIYSGNGVSTGDTNMELGNMRTGSGNAYIDLHATAGSDYEFRILRLAGANGNATLTNTGTGTLALATNGTARLTIDASAGNVGIGTSTPTQKLEVNGNAQLSSVNPVLYLNDTNAGADRPGIIFKNNGIFEFSGDDTPDLTSGSVLFNHYSNFSSTRAYSSKFRVFGSATSSWGNYLEFTHSGDNGYGQIATDVGSLILSPATGFVGIGTSTPNTRLAVGGAGRVASFGDGNGGAQTIISLAGGGIAPNGRAFVGYNQITANLVLQGVAGKGIEFNSSDTFGLGTMAIFTNAGNFGLGTTSPLAKLDLYGTAGSADLFAISSSSGSRLLTVAANGNVGVGTTSPVAALSLGIGQIVVPNGSVSAPSYSFASSPNDGLFIAAAGQLGLVTAGSERIRINSADFHYQGSASGFGISLIPASTTMPTFVPSRADTTTGVGGSSGVLSLITNGSSRIYVDGTGNIGIGTTTPVAKLDLLGTAGTADLFAVSSSSGSRLFTVAANGNVGVGTNQPNVMLDLRGTLNIGTSSVFFVANPNTGQVFINNASDTESAALSVSNPVQSSAAQEIINARFSSNSSNQRGILNFQRSRGTPVNPLDVTGTEGLGEIIFQGYSGGAYRSMASIYAGFDGVVVASSSYPTLLSFSTTQAGTTTRVERMRIDNNGNIGIGTTTPVAKLDILGTAGSADLFVISSSSGARMLTLSAAGNMTLTNGDMTTNQSIQVGNASGNRKIGFGGWTNYIAGETSAGNNLQFGINGIERIRINSSGIGIGTSTPSASLDLYGLATTSDIFAISSPSNTRLFTVASNGNVGIGTSTPGAKLDVSGTYGSQLIVGGINQSGSIVFRRGTDGTAQSYVGYSGATEANNFQVMASGGGSYLTLGTAGAEKMRIDTAGNVGIGTSTPSAQLTTTGTVRFAGFGAGSLQTDAAGNLSVSSDERLKDIQGQYKAGLTEVLGINPILYKWNATSGLETASVYAGFSAQNVRDFLPAAVGEDKRGFLTLSDRPILAAVVNAIKEMWTTITGVKSDVDGLKAENKDLKRRLDALEAEVKKGSSGTQSSGSGQSANPTVPAPAPSAATTTESNTSSSTAPTETTLPAAPAITEPAPAPAPVDVPTVPDQTPVSGGG